MLHTHVAVVEGGKNPCKYKFTPNIVCTLEFLVKQQWSKYAADHLISVSQLRFYDSKDKKQKNTHTLKLIFKTFITKLSLRQQFVSTGPSNISQWIK